MALKNCCYCIDLKTGVYIICGFIWVFLLLILFAVLHFIPEDVTAFISVNIGEMIIIIILATMLNALVIYGVYKKKRVFLLPWLIFESLECVGATLLVILFFVSIFQVTNAEESAGFYISFFFVSATLCAFCWYLWVVVYSCYIQLGEEEAGRPTENRNIPA